MPAAAVGVWLMWDALGLQVLMRRHAGQLRDTALSGYMSLTRVRRCLLPAWMPAACCK